MKLSHISQVAQRLLLESHHQSLYHRLYQQNQESWIQLEVSTGALVPHQRVWHHFTMPKYGN
jgi:hypothetical protein